MSYAQKTILAVLFSMVSVTTTQAFGGQPRALNVSMTGLGPGVDVVAMAEVRKIVGQRVADATLKTYRLKFIGDEGGDIFCVELRDERPQADLDRLAKELWAVKYDQQTTGYTVEPAAHCE